MVHTPNSTVRVPYFRDIVSTLIYFFKCSYLLHFHYDSQGWLRKCHSPQMHLPTAHLSNVLCLLVLFSDKVFAQRHARRMQQHKAASPSTCGPHTFKNENTDVKAIVFHFESPFSEVDGTQSPSLSYVVDSVICSRIQQHKLIKPHQKVFPKQFFPQLNHCVTEEFGQQY